MILLSFDSKNFELNSAFYL